jgi:hypothetical protein
MIYISLKYATFMIIIKNEIVVDCPPIAKWTLGKDINIVINYYKRKGAYIEKIK